MTPFEAAAPLLGTWRLAKCETSRPDLPQPTSLLTKFAFEEGAIHYSNDSVWSDGRVSKVSAVLQMDGNWYPVEGSLLSDSLSLRRLEDGSFEAKTKKGPAHVGATRYTVSADGQTLLGHWDVTGPGGGKIIWDATSERLP